MPQNNEIDVYSNIITDNQGVLVYCRYDYTEYGENRYRRVYMPGSRERFSKYY